MVSDYFSEEEIKTLDKCITYASGRRMIISKITREHEHNWQTVETPHRVCREMLGLIPEDVENFIIFFSLEFLEVLVKELGFEGDRVVFIADNELEANVATVLYGVKSVVYGKQEVSGIAIKELLEDTGMKFGKVAVVGNPPYQQIDGKGGKGTSAKPIYHLFVEAVIDHLTPDYFSFIVPSRWMVGGKGLANHRERMMNDNRMKKIVHFPGEHPIFENIFITGGTSYFLWCRNYSGKCEFVTERTSSKRYLNKYDLILQDNVAETILDKVLTKHSVYISNSCYSRNPFSIDGNFNKWALTGATCYSKGKQVNNIAANDYKDNFNIKNYYKVCVSKGDGAAQVLDKHGQKAVINSVFVLFPGEICTETYLVVKVFNSDNEAKHFSNYINSKFFRFLLGLRRTTPNLSRECFSWVPDLESYNKTWNDEELYAMFGLTKEESVYIESKIKSLT